LTTVSTNLHPIATSRSFLFVPGADERKLRKAVEAGADAVIADLEDAVAPSEKSRARDVVTDVCADRFPTLRLVRVNPVGSPWLESDLGAVAALGVDGVVLPKATPEALVAVGALDLPVVAIVESAAGLRWAHELAGSPAVKALLLGAVDLGVSLGLESRPDGLELVVPRATLAVASAAAGLRGPVDRVWLDIHDETGLRRDCLDGRSLGFRGKACIHPTQVPVVHEAFAPSDDEVRRAREVVDAYERAVAEGSGAVALDGEMIDRPVFERARQVLADAKRGVLDGN
jgi:citrate lyase subunit beta/citryl-CoA lyase